MVTSDDRTQKYLSGLTTALGVRMTTNSSDEEGAENAADKSPYDVVDFAKLLGISETRYQELRDAGVIPPPPPAFKIGNRSYWRRSEFDEWRGSFEIPPDS